MITEIIPNLYIGTIWDAISNKIDWKLIICVAEQGNFSHEEWEDLTCQNRPLLHCPFLVYSHNYNPDISNEYADLDKLEIIANIIDSIIYMGPILVHCAAGIERSPLVVVWYLKRWRGYTITTAYNLVMDARSIVQDRRVWLPEPYNSQ